MGTVIRANISEKNRYWIDKHRYYELKHFCLQYPIWKNAYKMLDGYENKSVINKFIPEKTRNMHSPTEYCAEGRAYYAERIELIERVSKETDSSLSYYILKGVTDGLPYDILKLRYNIPCGKDMYYGLYRRFFWLLSKKRG